MKAALLCSSSSVKQLNKHFMAGSTYTPVPQAGCCAPLTLRVEEQQTVLTLTVRTHLVGQCVRMGQKQFSMHVEFCSQSSCLVLCQLPGCSAQSCLQQEWENPKFILANVHKYNCGKVVLGSRKKMLCCLQ